MGAAVAAAAVRGGGGALGDALANLQPYVQGPAAVCGRACNRMWRGLQPYVPGPATVCAGACNPRCTHHLGRLGGEVEYACRRLERHTHDALR